MKKDLELHKEALTRSVMKPTKHKFFEHLEAAFLGAVFIGVGTIIASSVNADSAKAMPAAPTKALTNAPCAPQKSPDAMCTVELKNGPESRLCFGTIHPRCFEIKDQHIYQSLKGATVQNLVLDAKAAQVAQKAVDDYAKWLNSSLAGRPNKNFSCREPVSIESKSERKEYCLSALPKKDVDAKTNALISTLEHPGTSSH